MFPNQYSPANNRQRFAKGIQFESENAERGKRKEEKRSLKVKHRERERIKSQKGPTKVRNRERIQNSL